jgi:hypothetical protein
MAAAFKAGPQSEARALVMVFSSRVIVMLIGLLW